MANIEIYTKDWCPYCHRAKALLTNMGVVYAEYDVTHDQVREQEMRQRSARSSVPQIFIDGEHVGGFDDLVALEASGALAA
jgi:glutaredoxin 3